MRNPVLLRSPECNGKTRQCTPFFRCKATSSADRLEATSWRHVFDRCRTSNDDITRACNVLTSVDRIKTEIMQCIRVSRPRVFNLLLSARDLHRIVPLH